jgi:hypothetical protein
MPASCYRAALVLALCLGIAIQPSAAEGLHQPAPKRTIVLGRIVAKVPLEAVTSFGLNYESYIVEAETGGKQDAKQWIKFSYRFDQREPRLPKSFFDYSLTHKFRMTRDEDCDESWESISHRLAFDSSGAFQGRQNALEYAKDAPLSQPDPHLMLACFVATPRDYLATVKSAAQQPKPPIEPNPAAGHETSDQNSSAKAVASAIASPHKVQ